MFQEHESKLIKSFGDGNRIATALLYVSFLVAQKSDSEIIITLIE
jgi:hypothetical protein